MGYVLLWIEHLVVLLLLVATLVACFGRLRQGWLRLLLVLPAASLLLLVHAAASVVLGYLHFKELVLIGPFYQLGLLAACYAIGAVWLIFVGLRRGGGDPKRAKAASWPLGRIALLLCIAVGLHMMTWWNLDLAVRQQMASLDAEAAAAMLSVAPARLPDRDNAALIYEQTYEALTVDSWSEARRGKWNELTKIDSQTFDPDDPELKSLLDEQAPTLMLLRQGAQKPGCHFGREYGRLTLIMQLPEIGKLRDGVRLLSLDARYRAAQGDVQTALGDVDAMFSIAEHVGSDPLLVSTMTAIGIDVIAIETLQQVLAAEGLLAGGEKITTEQLQSIDVDGSLSFQRLFRRSLLTEDAAMLHAFQQFSCGDPDSWVVATGDTVPRPVQSLYRMFLATTDVASYRKTMDELSRSAAKPYHEAKSDLREFETRFKLHPCGLITRLLVPALGNLAAMAADGDARLRTARLALAAARYRAENGNLPQNLDELVPDYIPILPRDPFDGKPMKYRITDDGAVIYSIGRDDKDDNGALWDKDAQIGDITFELKQLRTVR